jgi:PAT family beta-lactamase induction signal transducer AmpG
VTAAARARAPSLGQTLSALASTRMLVTALMGFASGLPLLLTGQVLQFWLRDEGVDLATLGYAAAIGVPYTLKFVWAPLLDRYTLPLGRRRGWLLLAQSALVLAIAWLGLSDPSAGLGGIFAAAFAVAFFSATQDAVIDAYRREHLPLDELGTGSAVYVFGYRLGMLLASGGGLLLAEVCGFAAMYLTIAAIMAANIVVTLLAPEPRASAPATGQSGLLAAFAELLSRPGIAAVLAFVLCYKLGDALAAAMTFPFYRDLGFSAGEVGAVVKLFGFAATVGGGLLGGVLMQRLGLFAALFAFGVLQMLSTAAFVLLAFAGRDLATLSAVIAFENVSAGMGTAAYMAFMAAQSDRRFSATQYALFSSIMAFARTLLATGTGWAAEFAGFPWFFTGCALAALPGLSLLLWLRPQIAALAGRDELDGAAGSPPVAASGERVASPAVPAPPRQA